MGIKGEKKGLSKCISYEGHPSNHMTPRSCMSLLPHVEDALHGWAVPLSRMRPRESLSLFPPAAWPSQPAYRAMAMKGEWLILKDDLSTLLSPPLSASLRCHTSTAAALSPTLCRRKRALFTSWAKTLRLLFTKMVRTEEGMTHYLQPGCTSPPRETRIKRKTMSNMKKMMNNR